LDNLNHSGPWLEFEEGLEFLQTLPGRPHFFL
jgi:hypothetical protein